MNLRGIANGLTRSINPNVSANLLQSTGYATNADFSRTPLYTGQTVTVQPQALSYNDLMHIDGLNIQGVRRAVYANGFVAGIIRVKQKGGDVLAFPDGTLPEGNIWLVVHVLEQWPDWAKFVITLQDDNLAPGGESGLDYSNPDNSQYFPGLG